MARKQVFPGARRGSCADCGYRAWLDEDGLVPEHETRRVQVNPKNGRPQIFKGTETGDDRCSGTGKAPEPMPRVGATRKHEKGSMAA
jgi:hypothetical protein